MTTLKIKTKHCILNIEKSKEIVVFFSDFHTKGKTYNGHIAFDTEELKKGNAKIISKQADRTGYLTVPKKEIVQELIEAILPYVIGVASKITTIFELNNEIQDFARDLEGIKF
jgi:hypothetical protein